MVASARLEIGSAGLRGFRACAHPGGLPDLGERMKPFRFGCPICGRGYAIRRPDQIGRKMRCSGCGQIVVIAGRPEALRDDAGAAPAGEGADMIHRLSELSALLESTSAESVVPAGAAQKAEETGPARVAVAAEPVDDEPARFAAAVPVRPMMTLRTRRSRPAAPVPPRVQAVVRPSAPSADPLGSLWAADDVELGDTLSATAILPTLSERNDVPARRPAETPRPSETPRPAEPPRRWVVAGTVGAGLTLFLIGSAVAGWYLLAADPAPAEAAVVAKP
jgi:DNA-directed RNA polymerase subunit RPC12/RpoP